MPTNTNTYFVRKLIIKKGPKMPRLILPEKANKKGQKMPRLILPEKANKKGQKMPRLILPEKANKKRPENAKTYSARKSE